MGVIMATMKELRDERVRKLEELKKAYKQASKLTNQIFYLPIMRDEDWRIFQYVSGNERTLTKEEFINFCKRKIVQD